MADRPNTFAALIERIVGTPAPDQPLHRPVFARGAEITAERKSPDEDWWAILHSASPVGVILIHQHRIVSSQIEVRIDASGAVLWAMLDVKSTQPRGELFETVAEFPRPCEPSRP